VAGGDVDGVGEQALEGELGGAQEERVVAQGGRT
jgi:hypothetical protein